MPRSTHGDDNGKTALTTAAFCGFTDIAVLLLDHKADIEAKESVSLDATPLVLASENGHADLVRVLLTHGANPNASDSYHQSALIWAIVNGHDDVCRLLLAKGADPNAKDYRGQTPLRFAKGNAKLVALLKSFGASK